METQTLNSTDLKHIERLAKRIFDHGLSVPAILFLDMMIYYHASDLLIRQQLPSVVYKNFFKPRISSN